jgi:hypothetical protein
MFDPDDPHDVVVVEDAVHDAVRAAACGVVAGEFALKWTPDPLGRLEEWADEKLDDRRRDTVGQPRE